MLNNFHIHNVPKTMVIVMQKLGGKLAKNHLF